MFGRCAVTVFILLCNRTVGFEEASKKETVASGEGWVRRGGVSKRCR